MKCYDIASNFCQSKLILPPLWNKTICTVTDQQSLFSFSSLPEEQIHLCCASPCTFCHIIHACTFICTHFFAHKDRGIVTDSFQSLIHPGTADPSELVFGESFNLKVEKMKPSFLTFLVINFFEIRVLYKSHFFSI